MSTATYTYYGTLELIECYKCHITFGVPPQFDKDRLKDHENFWCPAGHSQVYRRGQSDIEKVRAELEREQRIVINERSRRRAAEEQAEHEKRSAAAQKGHATRLRRRAANGVCPCCKRSFAQLKAHMDNKHPEFVEAVKP